MVPDDGHHAAPPAYAVSLPPLSQAPQALPQAASAWRAAAASQCAAGQVPRLPFVVTCTGMKPHQLRELNALLLALGGRYEPQFTSAVTHVLAASRDGLSERTIM